MNFLELVAKSRSYRGYDPDRRLTREELSASSPARRLAPSSVNRQPLKYYLAWEEEQAAAIQPLTRVAALGSTGCPIRAIVLPPSSSSARIPRSPRRPTDT